MDYFKNLITKIKHSFSPKTAVAIVGTGYVGFVGYMIYQLKYSNKIRGLDKMMLKYVKDSAMISVVEIKNKTPDEIRKILRDAILKSIDSKDKLLTRYIDNGRIKYDKSIGSDLSDRIKNEIIDSIMSVDPNIENIEDVYKNEKYTRNELPIKIYYHPTKPLVCFLSNHAYTDGWTVMNFLRHIGMLSDSYKMKLPKPFYCPIVTEYTMFKTVMDIKGMEKPALDAPEDFMVRDVINIKFNSAQFSKTNDKGEKMPFIGVYIHNIIQRIFKSCDKDHFNIAIAAAVYNPNKINNLAVILFTIYKDDTLEDIVEKIAERKYMVMSSYLITSLRNSSGSSGNIDILFSSLPGSKDNESMDPIVFYLPYVTHPIYIANIKVHNVCTTAIHLKTKEISSTDLKNNLQVDGENIYSCNHINIS